MVNSEALWRERWSLRDDERMSRAFTGPVFEEGGLTRFDGPGYTVLYGPGIVPIKAGSELKSYQATILPRCPGVPLFGKMRVSHAGRMGESDGHKGMLL